MRRSGTESQSSNSTYRSQTMQLDSAPRDQAAWWGVSLPWELVADRPQPSSGGVGLLFIHTPLFYPKALNDKGILMPLISEIVIESQAS